MRRDVRETSLYQEAESLFRSLRQPGTGQISDAMEVHACAHADGVVFAGTLMDKLQGVPPTRIGHLDLRTGHTRVLTFGPNIDRLPKFSPDGCRIAFLSDRHHAGDFQLYLLDPVSGAVRPTPPVSGWVEYLHWSPDGTRILLGVAGHGADISGGQGAIPSSRVTEDVPPWMPLVETGDESYRWRRTWVYELGTNSVHQVSGAGTNVWEAVWCGNDALAGVVSSGSGEGLWYNARLALIELTSGNTREIYTPEDQLGWPASSPSGRHLAIVEAMCSDRWIVAGELRLIEVASGKVQRVDTCGVDITSTEWRSDERLLLAGHRGLETVVGCYDTVSATFTEMWSSRKLSTGGFYVTVSGLNETGDCVLVGEGFLNAPEIAVIRNGVYRAVKSFDLGYADHVKVIETAEGVTWRAPDGLEIQGWLLRPKDKGPHPLVMSVHGGPVWLWHPMWLGRRHAHVLMLLKRGYAVFFPNPRGSAGRGQEFIRHVLGDMGGADTYDYLSGLDHLVDEGIADPNRLGVTGISYGGFMTSWLITQDARFAAAVSVAPHTNHVSAHLISNISSFVAMYLRDCYTNPRGKYFQRSPVMHAHKVKTPTLNMCGALDRSAPPAEAIQFHSALLENGAKSVLVTYPEEGHGVRKLPAAIDYATRLVDWFEEHMPAADH